MARCERKTVVSNSEEDWIFTPFEKPNYLYIIMMNDGGDNNSKSRMIIHKQPDNHIHYRSNNDYVKYLKRLQYTKIRKWRPMGEFKLRCPKLPRRASNYSLNTTLAITCAIKKFFFFFMQRFAGVVSINIHGAWNIKGEYLSAFIFLRIIKKWLKMWNSWSILFWFHFNVFL